MQFNFTNAHIPGKMTTAAVFLTRSEVDPYEKFILEVREDVPTKPIKVMVESTGIVQDEPVFLVTTDQHRTTEKSSGNVKKKQVVPYQQSHQSSQCSVIMPKTYTKTQQF